MKPADNKPKPCNFNDHELKMRVIALRYQTRRQLNVSAAGIGSGQYASEEEVSAWVSRFYPQYDAMVEELVRRKISLPFLPKAPEPKEPEVGESDQSISTERETPSD